MVMKSVTEFHTSLWCLCSNLVRGYRSQKDAVKTSKVCNGMLYTLPYIALLIQNYNNSFALIDSRSSGVSVVSIDIVVLDRPMQYTLLSHLIW